MASVGIQRVNGLETHNIYIYYFLCLYVFYIYLTAVAVLEIRYMYRLLYDDQAMTIKMNHRVVSDVG